jgi:hypothetical protein
MQSSSLVLFSNEMPSTLLCRMPTLCVHQVSKSRCVIPAFGSGGSVTDAAKADKFNLTKCSKLQLGTFFANKVLFYFYFYFKKTILTSVRIESVYNRHKCQYEIAHMSSVPSAILAKYVSIPGIRLSAQTAG